MKTLSIFILIFGLGFILFAHTQDQVTEQRTNEANFKAKITPANTSTPEPTPTGTTPTSTVTPTRTPGP